MNTNVITNHGLITPVKTIGERISWARAQRGLSQATLAQLAGVSQGTIGNIESGLRKSPRALLGIARALNASPQWIESGSGSWEAAETPSTDQRDEALRANLNALVQYSKIDNADVLSVATGLPSARIFQVLRGPGPVDVQTAEAIARATDCDPLLLHIPNQYFVAMLRQQNRLRFSSAPIEAYRDFPANAGLQFADRAGGLMGVPATGEIVIAGTGVHIEPPRQRGVVFGTGVVNGYALRVRGNGGAPVIKRDQFLILEPTDKPLLSDFCLVDMSHSETVLLAEFLQEDAESYTVLTFPTQLRVDLQKSEVGHISGVVAIVPPRQFREYANADNKGPETI